MNSPLLWILFLLPTQSYKAKLSSISLQFLACDVKHEDWRDREEDLNWWWMIQRKGRKWEACEVRDMMKDAIRDEEGLKGSSMNAMDELLNAAFSER